MKDKKRAWLYCRVASPENADHDLQTQKKELLDYATNMGFEVVGVSKDSGSGLSYERPGLTDCAKAASDGSMDVLVVKEFAQIGRDINKTYNFLCGLDQLKIALYTQSGEFDFNSDAMSLFIRGLLNEEI